MRLFNIIQVCGASALVGILASAARAEPAPGPMHGPMRAAAQPYASPITSGNWSGYAVTGDPGTVTAVTGSWVIPAATCGAPLPPFSGASQWIGIDGYNTSTVEQTGTDVDCTLGVPRYYAWYEFFPAAGVTIWPLAMSAGDVVSAAVTYANGEFTLAITNVTSGQSFSVSHAVPEARLQSAEWITEANSYHFTDFGTAFFGEDETRVAATCTATVSGRTAPIGAFAPALVHEITMVDARGATLAVPSPLSRDGKSFSVEWLAVE